MDTSRPSTTALIAAFARAYHVAHERPPIFDDYLASSWFTDEERATYFANLSKAHAFFAPDDPAPATREEAIRAVLRSQSLPIMLTRARMAEDAIGARTQYVVLGAGLDTFAFRSAGRTVRVFEVDLPNTQTWKRARIAQLGWDVPRGLCFVTADLAEEPLAVALIAAGFDPTAPTAFAWLGVTYYLTAAIVENMLAQLAELAAPGSVLVFDAMDDAAFDPARVAPSIAKTLQATSRTGEPMRAGFAPGELRALLARTGWQIEEQLGPADIEARFFAERTDGYTAMPHFWLVKALRA
jgi:methyltransferase (TIGR00027 family)